MSIEHDKTLIVIAGPTATGKTETAVRVALELGTEILSADSRQFYSELTIGTAKPTTAQLSAVRHHFIGHISITQEYNVSMFEKEGLRVLESLFGTNNVAIMAGGSGLYIDALCKGIDDLPDADPSIRRQLRDGYEHYGIQYLRNRLLDLDPDHYAETDTSNPQRLIRALEVCMATGMPYSSLRSQAVRQRPFRIRYFGMLTSRDELYARINRRTDAMMENGLEDEARRVYPFRRLNSLNTVGYKELFDHFDGKCTLEEAVIRIKTNTRRYAKRQLTWFKRNPEMVWLDPAALDSADTILKTHTSNI
jgi:tRNA dimethylallyltransferase